MFKEFFFFELKNWFKSPMVYLFFAVNFILVFSASISENVTVGSNMGNVNINSPFALMSYAAMMSLISVVMTTSFVNQAALKDFNNNFDSILFAAPIKQFPYLVGRFLSSVLVSCIPLFGILLAVYLAPFFYDDASKIGPQYLSAYVDTFFTFLLPNTILICSIIFALAVKFKSTTISFIGAIFLLMAYLFATSYISNHDYGNVALIADPFGVNSISEITKYWTLSEKNSKWLSFGGPILMNRLLWLGVAIIFFMISYFNFSFSKKRARKKTSVESKSPEMKSQFKVLESLPLVSQLDNANSRMAQFYSQFKSDFLGIIKSPAFLIIVLFSAVNLLGGIIGSDNRYGSGNFPVTYIILEGIEGSLHLFIYIIIAYYTGAMVWRERRVKYNEILDASPLPTWIPMASKYVSMLAVVMLILLCAMFMGIGIQAVKGYYIFEPMLYFKQLFLIDLSQFAILIAVSLFIHVCVNQMYLGFFLFVIFLILNTFLWSGLNIDSNLLTVGGIPSFTYSDMHQYSLGESGLRWYNFYWLLFAGILIMTSMLFWVRGKGLNLKNRWAIAKQRFGDQISVPFYSISSSWIIVGGFLFYNANILNNAVSENEETARELSYEQMYKQYEHAQQPRIIALDHAIDLYPHSRKMKAKTAIILKNKHDRAIDSIHLSTSFDYETTIELPNSTLIHVDEERHYYIYQLNEALQPGDSLKFDVHSSYEAKGIENEISMKWINENGSFIHNYSFMPTIGYDSDRENHKTSEREKRGLAKNERMPELQHSCSAACSNTYISSDSDWIQLSSTISTSSDQIAIAPGTLMREWTNEGRNYYRYELDKPVLNFYSFLSARYEVKREKWAGVDLEVYYHKGHEFNVDKMMQSMRSSLDYFSNNFSPYPHKQARIIEFPRYAGFAQAFPGTMPYSENMGFIADLKDTSDVDKVFHTVAHEMAHQWWAHQVIGANMQGATMLSETFAQYSALMVLEKEYGKELSEKYVKYEMDAYLRSRGGESTAELPLMKVENQAYIHYAKGSVVMNAIKEYIGEDSLNLVMQRFIDKTAYQEPPYTNTNIFMEELEEIVPDTLQYLIDDMFRNIVLYNNKIESGTYKKTANDKYELTLKINVEKLKADKIGKEEAMNLDEYINIGVYTETENGQKKELYLEMHHFTDQDNTVTIVLDQEPMSASIDPGHLLIDRMSQDNKIELTKI